jgi:zinc D-Ala-D-Ala carboxypeptidase
MSSSESARAAGRRTRSRILAAALVLVTAALIGVLGCSSLAASSLSATSPEPTALRPRALRPADSPPRDRQGAPGEADVAVPDGTTVFEFYVYSGWRSREDQEQLFRAAVSKYGSKEEAARWVATPGTSAHERGNAVDLGHSDATAWLSKHGAKYGVCQIYRNEPWHYERRPNAVDHGCPAPYADPTQDPRTHR